MLIKVRWTPQNAAFHRKVNMNNLYDDSIELRNRLTTFDGPSSNCAIGATNFNARGVHIAVDNQRHRDADNEHGEHNKGSFRLQHQHIVHDLVLQSRPQTQDMVPVLLSDQHSNQRRRPLV